MFSYIPLFRLYIPGNEHEKYILGFRIRIWFKPMIFTYFIIDIYFFLILNFSMFYYFYITELFAAD
jgi:hypothetical protein